MVYLIHRHSSNWLDGSRFKPERWLERSPARTSRGEGTDSDNANVSQMALLDNVDGSLRGEQTKSKAPVAWMPYNHGRRDCIGKVLADVSMMTTLAALLGNFHFRLAKRMGSPEEVAATSELRINLHSGDGMWLHAIPRSG
eukprot:jgi/Botrbrau1/7678/Bobra.0159s0120.1